MSYTLLDAQTAIASEMDQSPTAPTDGGTDWNIRKNALNRALIDFKQSREWESLKVLHNGLISTSTGNATYVLPSNFDKLDSKPLITWDGSTTDEFPAVDPSNNHLYLDTDKFVNVFTYPAGKALYIHSSLISGASVQFTYYKSPQSLASATDVVECPDPTYIVQRALYLIYKGREDGRFPEAKVEADKILARMMENETSLGVAYVDRSISGQLERKGFVIGRDG